METDLQVMQAGETREIEEQLGEIEGRPRIWLSTKSPLRDAVGQVVGLVGVSIEITERKQAEERRRLILDELNHRVKNTLVTVQSITQQTLRGIDAQLRDALEGRLLALAAAHDVLVREQWESASLEEVVTASLAPHGGRHSPRFDVSGPPLRLRPRAALALAMGLHELATNAVKYGALSLPAGQVALHWEVKREGSPRFHLRWTEHGGPPATPPSRRGFGTRLLERSLTQDLRGKVQINYAQAGLECLIDAPLAEVAPGAVVLPHRGVNGQAQAAS